MVISYKNDAPIEEVESLIETLKNYCSNVQVVKGEEISLICLVGETKHIDENMINVYPWINSIARVSTPYKLVSREFKHEDTIINVKGVAIGGEKLTIIAGPCAVESREQILSICSSLAFITPILSSLTSLSINTTMVTSSFIAFVKLSTLKLAIIATATITSVIVIHDIDANDKEKFLNTLLKESLTHLKNILKGFII